MHDWCYTTTSCMALEYNLPYFVPYKWKCNRGSPYCGKKSSLYKFYPHLYKYQVGPGKSQGSLCSHQLCECDRTFVNCLAQFACPKKKAMCTSPWRYFQNLFMGLGTGMVSRWLEVDYERIFFSFSADWQGAPSPSQQIQEEDSETLCQTTNKTSQLLPLTGLLLDKTQKETTRGKYQIFG